jgi:hypothetical protein
MKTTSSEKQLYTDCHISATNVSNMYDWVSDLSCSNPQQIWLAYIFLRLPFISMDIFCRFSQSMYHDVNIRDPTSYSLQIQAQMCARDVSERVWRYMLIKPSLSSLGMLLDIRNFFALSVTHTSSLGSIPLIYCKKNRSNPHNEMVKISDIFKG